MGFLWSIHRTSVVFGLGILTGTIVSGSFVPIDDEEGLDKWISDFEKHRSASAGSFSMEGEHESVGKWDPSIEKRSESGSFKSKVDESWGSDNERKLGTPLHEKDSFNMWASSMLESPSPTRVRRTKSDADTITVDVTFAELSEAIRHLSIDNSPLERTNSIATTPYRNRATSLDDSDGDLLIFSHAQVMRQSPALDRFEDRSMTMFSPQLVRPVSRRGDETSPTEGFVKSFSVDAVFARNYGSSKDENDSDGEHAIIIVANDEDRESQSFEISPFNVAHAIKDLRRALKLSGVFEAMLSFPFLGYNDDSLRDAFQSISSIIRDMPFADPKAHSVVDRLILGLDRVPELTLWARAIAEIFADVNNAPDYDKDILIEMSAPYVLCFHELVSGSNFRLNVSEILLDEPLLEKYLSKQPPLYNRPKTRSGDIFNVVRPKEVDQVELRSDIKVVFGYVKLLGKKSSITADSHQGNSLSNIVTAYYSFVRSELFKKTSREEKQETDSLTDALSRLKVNDSPRDEVVVFDRASLASKFCDNHSLVKVLKSLRKGLKKSNTKTTPIELTRIAVGILDMCKNYPNRLTWKNKLDLVGPLLQDGLYHVRGYHEATAEIQVMPGKDLMRITYMQAMQHHFSKLELQNEVNFIYLGTEAAGTVGPRVECISKLINYMADPNFRIFQYTDERAVFLQPARPVMGFELTEFEKIHFRAFGRLLGLAVRYDITAGIRFAPSVLWLMESIANNSVWGRRTMTPRRIRMADTLAAKFHTEQDPVAAKHLAQATTELVSELADGTEEFDSAKTKAWITERRHNIIVDSVTEQIRHIIIGMADAIKPAIVKSFTVHDYNAMFVGSSSIITVEHLKENISFDKEITEEERGWLWATLGKYTQTEIEEFLEFVSGSRYAPLSGMKDEDRVGREWLHIKRIQDKYFPMSHTCFVLMDLPKYDSIEVFQQRLRDAVQLTDTLENK